MASNPARFRLGVYDADPDKPEVAYSRYTFANTPEGIQSMRQVIAEYYARGNPHCVGVFPAQQPQPAYVRLGLFDPLDPDNAVEWIGRKRKESPRCSSRCRRQSRSTTVAPAGTPKCC